MMARGPIGVFDSGVGGLSVLREIRRELPHEDLLYVADSGHAPYGDKPMAFIEARALAISDFLLVQGAKAMVVACNTASGAAAQRLRARHALPVVAMEPAVKPAVEHSRSGVVGVLATRQTLAGEAFAALLKRVRQDVEVLAQPCPGLVEQVERGDLDGPETRALVQGYVNPLLARGADVLVLGCTHYPHLRPLIESCAGPAVCVLDSGLGVARQVRRRLAEAGLLAPESRSGCARFWTTGALSTNRALMERLWREPIELSRLEPDTQSDARTPMSRPLASSTS
ncbi:MAG: glutamate racemase [Chromatiaceae bacterium]|nr:glutamate racemase [Chromatiaceae bacterium]